MIETSSPRSHNPGRNFTIVLTGGRFMLESGEKKTIYGCPKDIFDFYKDFDFDYDALEIIFDSPKPRVLGMLSSTDGWSSTPTLAKDIGTVGYLPTGRPFRFHSYEAVPCSMIRKSFYDKHISGKALPWLNSSYLLFDSNSIIPYSAEKPLNVGSTFGGPHIDFSKLTKVHGLGLFPFVFCGIPCIAQVLIVDDIFPNQPPIVNANRFDVIFDLDVFVKLHDTIPGIALNCEKTIVFQKEPDGVAKLDIKMSEIDLKRTLFVWVDGCCLNNGMTGPGEPNGGIGVYYAKNSLFNTSIPASELDDTHATRITNQRAELLAGIKAFRQVLTLRNYHGYVFEAVELRSDSEYFVKGTNDWLPSWKERKWRTAAGRPVANKDLWVELDELIKNFHVPDRNNKCGMPIYSIAWIPRRENYEADKLAKAGAEMDAVSPNTRQSGPRSGQAHFPQLEPNDQRNGVKSLKLGFQAEGDGLQRQTVKVRHAELIKMSIPPGSTLIRKTY